MLKEKEPKKPELYHVTYLRMKEKERLEKEKARKKAEKAMARALKQEEQHGHEKDRATPSDNAVNIGVTGNLNNRKKNSETDSINTASHNNLHNQHQVIQSYDKRGQSASMRLHENNLDTNRYTRTSIAEI